MPSQVLIVEYYLWWCKLSILILGYNKLIKSLCSTKRRSHTKTIIQECYINIDFVYVFQDCSFTIIKMCTYWKSVDQSSDLLKVMFLKIKK
jgi:hypothetical protein